MCNCFVLLVYRSHTLRGNVCEWSFFEMLNVDCWAKITTYRGVLNGQWRTITMYALTVCVCVCLTHRGQACSNYCYLQCYRLTLSFNSLSSPHLPLFHLSCFYPFLLFYLSHVFIFSHYPLFLSIAHLASTPSSLCLVPWYQTLLSLHLASPIPSSLFYTHCHPCFLPCLRF